MRSFPSWGRYTGRGYPRRNVPYRAGVLKKQCEAAPRASRAGGRAVDRAAAVPSPPMSSGHGHAHGHDDHHHHHAPSADADLRWLAVALGLIAGFMVVEVVGGLLASSLALLSDAAHMLTDAAAIGLALVAARLAARPARGRCTFGFGRAEILSAQGNGAAP